VIAVAVDEDVDKIRPAADGITYPVLIDADHVVAELYAISNVPTVVLIDEHDRIVQPNWNAFSNDMFREVTGIDSNAQRAAIRRWVVEGTPIIAADEARGAVGDLSAEEEQAKLHFRIGVHLRAAGDAAGAQRNFARSAELSPFDWTNRRAAVPLQGGDPFGEPYRELAVEYQAAGRPYHGIPGTSV
jgi:hypothetical protein